MKKKESTVRKILPSEFFQALRIDVNREFEVLYEFMEKASGCAQTRRTRGNPDFPLRRGQTGQESTESRI